MTTFGYAERPAGLTGPAIRATVNERPAARGPLDDTGNLVVRGEGRTRHRPHHNEAPPRPAAPGGNAKPIGGRVASPARPTMPVQGRRSAEPPAAVEESMTETAVLPAVAATPAPVNAATGYPSRPDPSDPATEVWTLVERAQAGEAEAFGLIYDRYVDTVFRFVYFRVGNRQLAEDLTSDTFLRALKRIGSFTWQGRDLGAWLVTIARNLVADHFKSGRYRLEVTTGDVLDADREDRGPEGSPEAAVVEHITNVALLSAVKQLNPEQQECIVLRFLQGFSVAETARTMGKNEGAIKALQYRAVRALARLLPDGFQP
ncbi:ECF subfamily RNA polymerase sigma factor, BldN family [Micromonospora endolithica]|uniref:Sigma-70 family RNA polymerase sigma factor n=1 Tax=Micromonospora endolithica TaxID=230091 RepID=A0A3A9Z767_9ACTN|nr:ECF subfamily RNA polymerase sigma factor, BldN family [Micromonospora endolithica]RKN44205.1 sigma-70 family RNA polymerase sigma factor [Micromonospora endolithica]TWJ25668.1 RNA polymerase sigma-70 factor (ECF subfamily) [Micromonospora endolithica]